MKKLVLFIITVCMGGEVSYLLRRFRNRSWTR